MEAEYQFISPGRGVELIDPNEINYISLKDGRRIQFRDLSIIPSAQATFHNNSYSTQYTKSKEIIPYETEKHYIYETPIKNKNIYSQERIYENTSFPESRNQNIFISNNSRIYRSIPPLTNSYCECVNNTIYNSSHEKPFAGRCTCKIQKQKAPFQYNCQNNYKYKEVKCTGRNNKEINRNSFRNNYVSSLSNNIIVNSQANTVYSKRGGSVGKGSRYTNGSLRNTSEVWRGKGLRKRKHRKYI